MSVPHELPGLGSRGGEPDAVDGVVEPALELAQRRGVPDWLEVAPETFSGRVKSLPVRSDLTMPINEKLVVELYSK